MIRVLIVLMIVVASLVAVESVSAQCGPAGCAFRGAKSAAKTPARVVRRTGSFVRRVLPRNR